MARKKSTTTAQAQASPWGEAPFHPCVPDLQKGTIEVSVIGAGGNGAQMLTKLARLDHALRACGHPGGLAVTAFDPDVVTRANVGRQLFSPSDIGQSKVCVLINRINCFYGLNWKARPEWFLGDEGKTPPEMIKRIGFPHLLISCVDTAKSRRDIHLALAEEEKRRGVLPYYWLDLGNKKSEGQVMLGQPFGSIKSGAVSSEQFVKGGERALQFQRLPCITDFFPDLLDPKIKEEDNEPSCSLADSLSRQSLFVNDHMSDWAMQLLDDLLRVGKIHFYGAFINLETGRVNPLKVPT